MTHNGGEDYEGGSVDQAGPDGERYEQDDRGKSLSRLQFEVDRPVEGGENDKGDIRMVPYPQNISGLSQGHIHYPTQPLYYAPLKLPYNNPPPETWNASRPSYLSHYDTNNLYHIPPPYPYGTSASYVHSSSAGREIVSPVRGNNPKEKIRRSSSSRNNPNCLLPSKERNHLHSQTRHKAASPSSFLTTKSVRRKKKMYSDFVGVTYNKTHAKYQACITHYRKQHYLGRYKLAVDAALAYDESARLLKGSSWKVNFPTRQAYEDAKVREFESLGKRGGCAVDVAGSLAAVALKIEEIASNVRQTGAGQKVVMSADSVKHGNELLISNLVDSCLEGNENGKPLQGTHVAEYEKRVTPGLPPPPETVLSTPAMTKVTPSPTFQMSTLSEQGDSLLITNKLRSLDTPLPVSPNPARHAMGAEKGTPDSFIRPTVLTYQGGKEGQRSEIVAVKTLLPVSQVVVDPDRSMSMSSKHEPISYSANKSESRRWITAGKVAISKRTPPVIQNGTLAAASALMTLFGNEKSPQGLVRPN